jgi:23S rRNA pseudouridine2605 synthase
MAGDQSVPTGRVIQSKTEENFETEKRKTVRLNKYLADSGVSSRRQADKIIEEGRVTINGKKVFELGIQVDPKHDNILVGGKPIKPVTMKLYIMLHKPAGYLTTMEDPLERPTIATLLEKVPVRVFPVGRLDWDSEGLLLLTNDGDYAQKISHPTSEVTKSYLVKLKKEPSQPQIQKLLRGVSIVGGKVAAKSFERIDRGRDTHPWFKMVITEGKNRQIRHMIEKIGNDVLKLQRVAIGRLRIGALKRGELVFLNDVAAERVFLPDIPDEVKAKKTYKGRSASQQVAQQYKGKSKRVIAAIERDAKARELKDGPGSKKRPVARSQKEVFGE